MSDFRWTAQREKAAALVAEDRQSDEQIAAEVGVDRRTLFNWRAAPEFKARVQETVDAYRAAVRARGIAIVENRVAAQQDRWERMQALIQARAETHRNAPGGETGLLVRQVKMIGSGPNAYEVEEYVFDAALTREIRELEKHTSQELGQWTEKKDLTSDGKPFKVYAGFDPESV